MNKHIVLITLLLTFLSCAKKEEMPRYLIDKKATTETEALFRNLMKVQKEGKILFGHQDATTYGRNWSGDKDRSDVKDVTGSHPAIVGLDFGAATTSDSVAYNRVKQALATSVINTYKRGGITSFAWHASNPANDGSFYWATDSIKVIPDILPGGKLNDKFKTYLKSIADVASAFKGDGGEMIPVIFRPYHEYDGEWFWWGKGHCTKDEFITLWRFTVDYLRNDLGVHNFIYAFSPDCRFKTEADFMEYYPGDDYVDMLGMDNYWDFRPDGANDPKLAAAKLKIVSDVAERKNKLAAMTETGLEGIPQADWFTSTLLPVLQQSKICYVLVWRNAHESKTHYYAPDKGHAAEEDFKSFCNLDNILLENDLPQMYK